PGFWRRRIALGLCRLPGVVPAGARLAVELLDHLRQLLFHPSRADRRGPGSGLRVGAAPDRRPALESAPDARAVLAVRVLDSRRARLRLDFIAFTRRFHPPGGLDRTRSVLAPDGRPGARKGPRNE